MKEFIWWDSDADDMSLEGTVGYKNPHRIMTSEQLVEKVCEFFSCEDFVISNERSSMTTNRESMMPDLIDLLSGMNVKDVPTISITDDDIYIGTVYNNWKDYIHFTPVHRYKSYFGK